MTHMQGIMSGVGGGLGFALVAAAGFALWLWFVRRFDDDDDDGPTNSPAVVVKALIAVPLGFHNPRGSEQ